MTINFDPAFFDRMTVVVDSPPFFEGMVYATTLIHQTEWDKNREGIVDRLVEHLAERVGIDRATHGTLHVFDNPDGSVKVRLVAAP